MSDPLDPSWWWGGDTYTPDPSAAKLGGRAGEVTGTIGGALGGLASAGALGPVGFNAQGSQRWGLQQQQLADQLARVANGQQAGAGERAVNRQIGSALAQQQSVANSARGANALLAGREAARPAAGLGVTGAGMAHEAALQDQTAARGLQANVLQQGRQGSMSEALGSLQAQGMNQQQALAYMQQLTGMDMGEMQARIQQEGIQAGSYQQGMIGQALSGASSLATGLGLLKGGGGGGGK